MGVNQPVVLLAVALGGFRNVGEDIPHEEVLGRVFFAFMNRVLVAFLFCICWGVECLAALEWGEQERKLAPLAGETSAATTFAYKNSGTSAVSILAITSCCNCTFGEASKQVVPPGGQGVIKATFAFGDRTGLHEKYLVVHTDDLKEPTIVLTMSVQIPEPVKLVPALISWGAGELSSSRTVTLELLGEVSPAEIRATSSHPAFEVSVLVPPGTSRAKSYQLVIAPKPFGSSVSESVAGVLNVEVSGGGGKRWNATAQMRLRR